MFPHSQNSCPFPTHNSSIYQHNNQIGQKSLQMKLEHSRESRQNKLSRMRQINATKYLIYERISYCKFRVFVQNEKNPYSILLTIFIIVDDYSWRQYLSHLQLLIKCFTNFVQQSKGKILEQLTKQQGYKQKLGGYNLQQRLQTMLHLSDKQFQIHLLILIHTLIAYHKKYCIFDQNRLSQHLIYKHPYQKYIRQQILWLLTRISVGCQAMNKIIKNYLNNTQNYHVLPVLTIIANYIYEQPAVIIQNLITTNDFQNIVGRGLFSNHFQTQRQAVFICNNIIFKNRNCCNYILSQNNLVNQIKNLNNEEVAVFLIVINEGTKKKNDNQNMQEQQTS